MTAMTASSLDVICVVICTVKCHRVRLDEASVGRRWWMGRRCRSRYEPAHILWNRVAHLLQVEPDDALHGAQGGGHPGASVLRSAHHVGGGHAHGAAVGSVLPLILAGALSFTARVKAISEL